MSSIATSTAKLSTLFRRSSADSRSSDAVKALERVDVTRPIYLGRVFKQAKGEKAGFNKRFFVLFPKLVLYFKHKRDYYDDPELKLQKFKLLKLDGVYITMVDEPPAGVRFCCNLHLPDPFNQRSKILIAFSNRKERRYWMAHLQSQNPNLVPRPDAISASSHHKTTPTNTTKPQPLAASGKQSSPSLVQSTEKEDKMDSSPISLEIQDV